jgi:pyruvate kinase
MGQVDPGGVAGCRVAVEDEALAERAVTRVVVGGRISNRKGVSLPDTTIPVAALTENR